MLVLRSAVNSRQHKLTLSVLTRLHRHYGRPVLEHEIADELDSLTTADELPPPVDLVLGDLRRAGLTTTAASGWVPAPSR